MELKELTRVNTGVLVIGSGAAGLRAAIEARKSGIDVVLVSKSPIGLGNNTAICGGGFNAVDAKEAVGDAPEVHLRDTVVSGRFLNNQRVVQAIVEGAVREVSELGGIGVRFATRSERRKGTPSPGQTYPRSHASEEANGLGFTQPMRSHAQRVGVQLCDGVTITKLLTTGDAVSGAMGLDGEGHLFAFGARATILATGGLGQMYSRTNNVAGATGDGYALAYDIGACLQDMEFIQFYPTAFGQDAEAWYLRYEDLIHEPGVAIRNALGENILEMYDLQTLTRDKLTRAIMMEVAEGRDMEGTLAFDLTAVTDEQIRIAYSANVMGDNRAEPEWPSSGLEPGSIGGKFLRVAPTTHFSMGGVMVNSACETGISGLYAAGEACGGVHGANRLEGNALTTCFATGAIAGRQAATCSFGLREVNDRAASAEEARLRNLANLKGKEQVADLRKALKLAMWQGVGVLRNKEGLTSALAKLKAIDEQLPSVSVNSIRELNQVIALSNMVTVSEMVARAARLRAESRGAHYRMDHPEEDNTNWLRNITITKAGERMTLRPVDVDLALVAG